MMEKIKSLFSESIDVKNEYIKNEKNLELLEKIVNLIISCYKKNNKLIIFGNGGSAADAQHFACELVARFKKERKSLNAIALTTNTSLLTALGNDYNFDIIFSRQVESLATEGDIAIGISTSGNSKNVIEGIKKAKECGCTTIGLTGRTGGKMKDIVDYCICVPSDDVARIQETHITIIHIICDLVEQQFV